MAGYSATPLARKLGIKSGHLIALLDAPSDFPDLLEPLPAATKTVDSLAGGGPFDVVIGFTTRRDTLIRWVAEVRPAMTPAAGFWVAWPKKASKVPTEVTDATVREIALPTGLVDNKICAIDDIWTAMRMVIRVELR
jgi:hypothetical protein